MLIPWWPRQSTSNNTHDGGYNQHSGWKKKPHSLKKKAEKQSLDKFEVAAPLEVLEATTSPTFEVFDDSAFKQAQGYLASLYMQLSDIAQRLESTSLKQAYLKAFEENIRIFLEEEAQMRAEEEEALLMLLLN